MLLYNDVGEDSKCSKSFSLLAASHPKRLFEKQAPARRPTSQTQAKRAGEVFQNRCLLCLSSPTIVNKPIFEKQAPPSVF
jgi:hypothetical protein